MQDQVALSGLGTAKPLAAPEPARPLLPLNAEASPPPAAPRAAVDRDRYELGELLAISRAMASEKDIRALLDLILAKARQITGADAGSVYVVEQTHLGAPQALPWADNGPNRRQLRFMLSQNDSLDVNFDEFVLPVDDQSIVGTAALEGRTVNIEDLARLSEPERNPRGVNHNKTFDVRTGYHARSMLTVPMSSSRGEVIGVIQLINKKTDPYRQLLTPADFNDVVAAFDVHSEELAQALAIQAGVCLENAFLYDEIRSLFEGFVDASVTAIEARDPTTSGHSRRVATLSVALAERVDAITQGPLGAVHFSRDDLRQIEFAGVLHDFGKVGVREDVLVKAKKLYSPQAEGIRLRLDYVHKCLQVEALQERLALIESGKASADKLARVQAWQAQAQAKVERLWTLVLQANEPTLVDSGQLDELAQLAQLQFTDPHGKTRPYLDELELAALQVSRGSLTAEERREIESHVDHTIHFLQAIPWGRGYRRIPHIAGAHHESLDGTGYPYGLKGEEIPVESRILTIADIFDALTAADRPYKAAVPVTRALSILESEVRRGRCDALLFDVFLESKVFEKVL